MNQYNQSSTILPAGQVRKMCESTLSGIKRARARDTLNAYHAWRASWWRGPILKYRWKKYEDYDVDVMLAEKMPDDILRWMKTSDGISSLIHPAALIRFRYGRQEDTATKLLELSKAVPTEHFINITAEDYSQIS